MSVSMDVARAQHQMHGLTTDSMDTTMDLDARPTSSRKRSIHESLDDSDDDMPQQINNIISPKRSRGRAGSTVKRQTIYYNAQALLNELAFHRLFVTANFMNYNPSLSPILLCIVTHSLNLYHATWQASQSLLLDRHS